PNPPITNFLTPSRNSGKFEAASSTSARWRGSEKMVPRTTHTPLVSSSSAMLMKRERGREDESVAGARAYKEGGRPNTCITCPPPQQIRILRGRGRYPHPISQKKLHQRFASSFSIRTRPLPPHSTNSSSS
ncbi:unnamed protein product, partial [Pylaiella littoralis]